MRGDLANRRLVVRPREHKRWVAAAFLDAEKNIRRILGYRDLWMLKAVLNQNQVAIREQAT